jgi:hypothetical protein
VLGPTSYGPTAFSACRLYRFFPALRAFDRRIPTPPQRQIDTLQHNVVDLKPLFEGDLSQRLVDRLRQVET